MSSRKAKYKIDDREYTIDEVSAELGLSVDATRGRIYTRIRAGVVLSWTTLRKPRQGKQRLRKLLVKRPAAQYLRDILNARYLAVAKVAKDLGHKSSLYLQSVLRGEIDVSPQMADRLSDVLMLSDEEERKLHRLGAIQSGWKV